MTNFNTVCESSTSRSLEQELVFLMKYQRTFSISSDSEVTIASDENTLIRERPSVFKTRFGYFQTFNTFVEILSLQNKTPSRTYDSVPVNFSKIPGHSTAYYAEFSISDGELEEGDCVFLKCLSRFHRQAFVIYASGQIIAYVKLAKCESEQEEFILECSVHIPDNSVPYVRMKDALKQFGFSKLTREVQMLVTSVLGKPETSPFYIATVNESTICCTLNAEQLEAFEYSLNRSLSLISAPPGTGKTRLAAALAHYFASVRQVKVLLCAPSNNAADKLAEALIELLNLRNGSDFILRMYSRTREMTDLIPECKTYKIPERLKQFSLHHRIGGFDDYDDLKQRLEAEMAALEAAPIVITTCSGAGDKRLDLCHFNVAIIDETTQAVEPECLIPMMRGVGRAILFGDAMQLPPVVKDKALKEVGYGESMFERLLKVHGSARLITQYRMHPAICKFPSDQFYDGKLQNGVSEKARKLNPPVPLIWPRGAVTWFNNGNSSEKRDRKTRSFENGIECEQIAKIVEELFTAGISPKRVGIIAMYTKQVQRLRQVLAGYASNKLRHWPKKVANLSIGTVDSFQGQERDIIILSCVRSNANGNVGFLADERRLNVAWTRAKYGLVVVGNIATLKRTPVWSDLICYCQEAGSVLG